MTAKDLKNNYRNIRIVVLCFAIYILLKWFSPFLIVLDYNFIQILIPFIISGIVIFPIVVIGYKLLGDKGNYLEVLGIKGNIKEGLIVGGVLFLAAWVFSLFPLSFLQNLMYVKSLFYIFINIFVVELCTRAFFFRKISSYTKWGFFRIILFYIAIYLAVAIVTISVILLFNKDILSGIGSYFKLMQIFSIDLLLQEILSVIGIFLMLLLTEIFLFWLYMEWNFNFWVVVFAHLVLTLANDLTFEFLSIEIPVSILLIATGVIGTVLYKQRKGLPLEVKRFW